MIPATWSINPKAGENINKIISPTTINIIIYANSVPRALLIPFFSKLFTIPLNKNTKTIVQINIATGVDSTFSAKVANHKIAQTPRIVRQINALLVHFCALFI